MKRSTLFGVTALIGFSVAVLAVTISRNVSVEFEHLQADVNYTLTLNSSKQLGGGGEGTTDIQTALGNDIGFYYSRAYPLDGGWERMIFNSEIYNVDALSGIISLTATFTGSAPTISYGFDVDGNAVFDIYSGVLLTSDTPYTFDGNYPEYFKLSLGGDSGTPDCDISSITIVYSCSRTNENSTLRSIDSYSSTPLSGGESASAPNKGNVVYFSGESATISNVSITSNTLSFDHTTGSQWWSRQLFYTLPYSDAGDLLSLNTTITSTTSGTIVLNGVKYFLEAGTPKVISINTYVGEGAQFNTTAWNIQLGESGGTQLPNGHFSMTLPRIYSRSATYYDVTFKNDESVVATDYVKSGKTLLHIPERPTPESGYICKGWYNGETRLISSTTITADIVYSARFVSIAEANRFNVRFINLNNNSIFFDEEVIETQYPTGGEIEYGFGYAEYKFFSDAGGTSEINLEDMFVESDVNIYYLPKIQCYSIYNFWGDMSANVTTQSDGSLKFNGINGAAWDDWRLQINFGLMPLDNCQYTVTFRYELNLTGATYNLFKDEVVDVSAAQSYQSGSLPATDGIDTFELVYNGNEIAAPTRIQFGFGGCPTSNILFIVHSITLEATPL